MFIELFLFVVCIWLGRTLFQKNKGGYNIPPSPPAIPILGNFPVFMQDGPPFRILKKIGDKYGNLFSLKLGPGLAVVLHDAETIRQALLYQGKEFAGRPRMYTATLLSRNNSGIAFSENFSPVWQLHRKLAATAIRRNICGKNCQAVELKIQTEVQHLIDNLSHQTNRICDISRALNLTILNVICDMTYSRTYSIDDPEFLAIEDLNNKFTTVLQPGDPVDVMPFLKIFPNKKLKLVHEIIHTRDTILQRKYDEHLATFDPDNVRDLTDAYLAAMRECKDENGNNDGKGITEDHVIMAMWEFFTGGHESTFTTLNWAILYMITYPEVQRKIQDEMAEMIGTRLPTWKDHMKLPYLEGAVMETLRESSFTSLGGPRRAVHHTKLEGYDIPKDTIVFCNIWWAHHDPKYWDEPNEFKPERFIKNGRVVYPKAFLPFSIGRRQCLGSILAKMELFMVLGGILQRFNIRNPAGFPQPSLEPIPDMVLSPEPFKVWLEPRNLESITA